MIKKLEISSVRTNVTPELEKYINKKIGKLDRFLSRHARKTAHAKVVLTESKGKTRTLCCEVTLHIPGKVLNAKEDTSNMYSSIDIVETKLINQLRKYKEMHSTSRSKRLARKVTNKFRR